MASSCTERLCWLAEGYKLRRPGGQECVAETGEPWAELAGAGVICV